MKKIPLMVVKQHNESFLAAKIDPRELVRIADDLQVGEIQDAQRPLDAKHLKEIAAFVAESGELPASIIISTKKNANGLYLHRECEHIKVHYDDDTVEDIEKNYMLFPETDEEFEQYKGTIDVIDGQHRLYSFRPDFKSVDLKDNTPYEILVSIFELPVLAKRQRLFMSTNEKQQPVNGNLLMWLRMKLDLLSDTEKIYYALVESLANENCSPLQGRIILNAEKIKNGIKSQSLIKVFEKKLPSNLLIGPNQATAEQKFDIICKYLNGWENHYNKSFRTGSKDTMTKISGLRYIFGLFNFFWTEAINNKEKWDNKFFDKTLHTLEKATARDDLFENSIFFTGETSTYKAVEADIEAYKIWNASHTDNSFNPLL